MWLVDPLARTLEAFRLEGDLYVLLGDAYEGNVAARIPPFDAVDLDLSVLWADVILPDAKQT